MACVSRLSSQSLLPCVGCIRCSLVSRLMMRSAVRSPIGSASNATMNDACRLPDFDPFRNAVGDASGGQDHGAWLAALAEAPDGQRINGTFGEHSR